MSAFTVGRRLGEDCVWWETWRRAGYSLPEMRPATAEEEMLMNKIVWGDDNYSDRERLKQLLAATL